VRRRHGFRIGGLGAANLDEDVLMSANSSKGGGFQALC
jgi:hypothetical protein